MDNLKELANAIRILSADAIQKANSGHPGMPLGMADIATVLWREFLQHNPKNPHWINRDRFVVSNGHGSMLLYSLLHFTGYDLSLDEIKNFRQWHSKTPGHPEVDEASGVETTTGPLGQGLANAVGMALAEKVLAAQFNRPSLNLVDHYTYVFCGDGCLMEGISHEVCSFAGTHKLNKLVLFWDDNGISIDGEVRGWFTDNTPERFRAYGWNVIADIDGHDTDAVRNAIKAARAQNEKPTLICCKTIIGFGAPNVCGKSSCHGSPLGDKEMAALRENLGWKLPSFEIPKEIYAAYDAKAAGAKVEAAWQAVFSQYQKQYPELAQEFLRRIERQLPVAFEKSFQEYLVALAAKPQEIATRKASQNFLTAVSPIFPEFLGGSADLTESNLTETKSSKTITAADATGNYLHYGVREFGMCAMMSGMALHGGFIPFGGTFLVFSDYARSAIRMAAMMRKKVIYVLSHDSIGLGEDGPTHQPVEHLGMLRLTPRLSVWRPCDEIETAFAWQAAILRNGPTVLALTRQKVPAQKYTDAQIQNIARGGYILCGAPNGAPEVIIIATGSEVQLAVRVYEKLTALGKKVRVVSMPSTDVFLAQDASYQEEVLPAKVRRRLAIEAAAADYWYRFVGLDGLIIGLHDFGASAKDHELFAQLGFQVENIANKILSLGEMV